MTKTRDTKPPARFEDCVTSAHIDQVVDDKGLTVHEQSNGQTINIIVQINQDFRNVWKEGILSHFAKADLIKDTPSLSVLKVKVNDDENQEFTVTFNIYSTGSVVIQGPKCKIFERIYFNTRKDSITSQAQNPESHTDATDLTNNDY